MSFKNSNKALSIGSSINDYFVLNFKKYVFLYLKKETRYDFKNIKYNIFYDR